MCTVNETWTFDEAQAANEAAIASGRCWHDPTLPIYRWSALHEIKNLGKAFAAGDRMALFAALRKCANHNLVMPAWVSRAFIKGYDKVLNCRVGSWDEAFGRPYLKGRHLVNMRQDRLKRFAVYLRVKDLCEKERAPLGDDLFERVGKEMGLGKTRVKRLYYEARWPARPPKS